MFHTWLRSVFYCCWIECLYLSAKYIWSKIRFKSNISLLIFCLVDLPTIKSGVLMFPTIKVLLSISFQICWYLLNILRCSMGSSGREPWEEPVGLRGVGFGQSRNVHFSARRTDRADLWRSLALWAGKRGRSWSWAPGKEGRPSAGSGLLGISSACIIYAKQGAFTSSSGRLPSRGHPPGLLTLSFLPAAKIPALSSLEGWLSPVSTWGVVGEPRVGRWSVAEQRFEAKHNS